MPIVNRIADLHAEITEWRRDIHAHPEIQFDVHRTAGIVAEKLKAFGCDEVVPGIGKTGVVGVIHGRKKGSGKVIGMRADMDALPLTEETAVPYRSTVAGKMHACGHDGHTAMLLGAAKYLADTRNFDGTAVVIFQPAEEGGGGGREMVKDGMMERFGIQEVYAMHNAPHVPVGSFTLRPGPLLAAADALVIDIEGLGSHAAKPHEGIDSVVIGAHIVTAVQSIAARNLDPLKSCVVSICQFHAGSADNILPQRAQLRGTVRTLEPEVQDMVQKRLGEIVEQTAAMFGAKGKLTYSRNYPVTRNHERQTAFAAAVAADVSGRDRVDTTIPPIMGAEDFSFMLEARPGAMIMCGNGETASLHHPAYDFNDEAIPAGVSYWVRLAEMGMPS